VIAMLFSATITLAMAHSMNSMIKNRSEVIDDNSWNNYPSIYLSALSVIVGGIFGAMGVRGTLFFVLLIIMLLGGGGSFDGIFELIGIKGLVMIFNLILCVALYYFSISCIGNNFKDRKMLKSLMSRLLLLLNFVLNLILFVRITMILFFGFQVFYITEF
jgi:hypothetical protein